MDLTSWVGKQRRRGSACVTRFIRCFCPGSTVSPQAQGRPSVSAVSFSEIMDMIKKPVAWRDGSNTVQVQNVKFYVPMANIENTNDVVLRQVLKFIYLMVI